MLDTLQVKRDEEICLMNGAEANLCCMIDDKT